MTTARGAGGGAPRAVKAQRERPRTGAMPARGLSSRAKSAHPGEPSATEVEGAEPPEHDRATVRAKRICRRGWNPPTNGQ